MELFLRHGELGIMASRYGNLVVEEIEGVLRIGNGRVRAQFGKRDGGYVQEFSAIDNKGRARLVLSSLHKNMIPYSEHRDCSSPMMAGDRPHLFGMSRESLRMVYSTVALERRDEGAVTAVLSGTLRGHHLTCRVTVEEGSSSVHVEVNDEIRRGNRGPVVEYLMSSYAFIPDGALLDIGQAPGYTWAPCLRPECDHVIGDQAFHSPAVIAQLGSLWAALIPDLEVLRENRPMPTILDLDIDNGLLPAPLLSYGFCGYERDPGGSFFVHDMAMATRLDTHSLRYGFDLVLNAEGRTASAPRQVAEFLWRAYGAKGLASSERRSLTRTAPRSRRREAMSRYAEEGHGFSLPACTTEVSIRATHDPHTTAGPYDARAALWAARAMLGLYRSTGKQSCLRQGINALDELCLLQSVWDKPWTRVREFGLLADGNVEARLDPALSAEFAETAMEYGALTGAREYSERASAALAAAIAAPGTDDTSRARIAAAEAAIRSAYGVAFLHVGRKWSVSLDGARVQSFTVGRGGVSLEVLASGSKRGRLVFGGVRGAGCKVAINGRQAFHPREAMESGIRIPDG